MIEILKASNELEKKKRDAVKKVKVLVTVREIQYYEAIEEIEMSENEYKKYIKTGTISRKEDIDLTRTISNRGFGSDYGHQATEIEILEIDNPTKK